VLWNFQGRQKRLRLDGQQFLRRYIQAEQRSKAWIFVPEGYCERIVGGSKTAK
jgi:hypothetical protein